MMVCDKCGQESYVMTCTDKYPNLCDQCYYEDIPDSDTNEVYPEDLPRRQLVV